MHIGVSRTSMWEGRKLPGRSLFRIRQPSQLSTTSSSTRTRERHIVGRGGGGEKAVRIMTRRVSFETTCKQWRKHSEGKGWKWAVEWEESLEITGGRSLILAPPSIPAVFNPLSRIRYFQEETELSSVKMLHDDAPRPQIIKVSRRIATKHSS